MEYSYDIEELNSYTADKVALKSSLIFSRQAR